MSKRAYKDITNGIENWDGDINDNFALFDAFPTPLEQAASLSALETEHPANINDEAIAIAGDELVISNGNVWVPIGNSVNEYALVYNDSGSQINAGKTVSIEDRDATSGLPEIEEVDDYKREPIGIVSPSNISNATQGTVLRRGLYTSALSAAVLGEAIYADNAGDPTLTPTAHKIGVACTTGASTVIYVDFSVYFELGRPAFLTTEFDTGIDVGSDRIYRKTFTFTLANAGAATQAHGITALNVAKGAFFRIVSAVASDGTTIRLLPWYDGTDRLEVTVDATNIIVTSTKDETGSDVYIVLEYLRTA